MLSVIFFANELSTHSNTMEKTPNSSKILASFKSLFLSIVSLPLVVSLLQFANLGTATMVRVPVYHVG